MKVEEEMSQHLYTSISVFRYCTKRTCCVAISSAVSMGRTNSISRRAAQSCEFNGASFAGYLVHIYCL